MTPYAHDPSMAPNGERNQAETGAAPTVVVEEAKPKEWLTFRPFFPSAEATDSLLIMEKLSINVCPGCLAAKYPPNERNLNETSAAYLVALKPRHAVSVLALSRQTLPNLEGSTIEKATRGGYVLREVEGEDLTLISTGYEVSTAVQAVNILENEGLKIRVVYL
ncbi:hypothetical protein M422DRAFT_48827 [Sphaerobolus stellatus SS14]|uniref:Transketolase-like C-terminal domain-containing protein n=1 Tax=Sphaerobolus stellatus (strain SS14) TaxID=990650 RepID=A0A0C9UD88_SPHS4|nr:hypothetical protein M422DRAFT_48827 [Sphaerobolus stellatus SS14]